MKSMQPHSAAIFFMTNFYRTGGGGHGSASETSLNSNSDGECKQGLILLNANIEVSINSVMVQNLFITINIH